MRALEGAGISRDAAYRWRADDPEFAAAWETALQVGITRLEDVAHNRAFEGWEEPVFHQGAECGRVRKYSDTLSIFLLKAHRPEKYRERTDVNFKGELALKAVSDEDLEREIRELQQKLVDVDSPAELA